MKLETYTYPTVGQICLQLRGPLEQGGAKVVVFHVYYPFNVVHELAPR